MAVEVGEADLAVTLTVDVVETKDTDAHHLMVMVADITVEEEVDVVSAAGDITCVSNTTSSTTTMRGQ